MSCHITFVWFCWALQFLATLIKFLSMVLDSLKNLQSITDKPDPAQIFVGFPHSCTFNDGTVECGQYQLALQSPVAKQRGYILRKESFGDFVIVRTS